MRLEYIILIILAVAFYYINLNDYRKEKNRENFINNTLKIGSKVITKTGIIGFVKKIDKNEVILITGEGESYSYLTIEKSYIDNILE